ncbi:MAG TPA: penicillin acylase family protein [Rhodopila sp.]|nr:penicillin acylase family protein [Rhodopila sp.]
MPGFARTEPDSIDLRARLAAIPRGGLPLRQPVAVYWNSQQVPFIEASSDHDLAVALGVVHVHLRWAQLELMRHVVHGRLSALIGPFGLGMDRMLRTLDLPKAVPAIAAALPEETRAWIEGFVAGMNHAVAHLPSVPAEFRLLGLSRAPWTFEDVLALTRLAAFDVTWMVWLALLPGRTLEPVTTLWRRLLGEDATFDIGDTRHTNGAAARLHAALMRFARVGSNSWAVAPSRSASGAAWMANDTHLSPLLPNLWLLAGYRSPSHHAAGLMVPGVPAILVGRNPWIAWGGTNLHAASSDLFDIADLPDSAITSRVERIKVRGIGYRSITVRDSTYGPVISDLPRLRKRGGRFALRWMGHRPSDEITGLLGMNRARDWDSFQSALNYIGVPGQNILFAGADGRIAKAMAAHLPMRPPSPTLSPLLPRSAAAAWDTTLRSRDLPMTVDPPEGFVASANNRPPAADTLVGYFFSSDQRIERIRTLLAAEAKVDFGLLARMQRDAYVPAALPLRDRLVHLLRAQRSKAASHLADQLQAWDGQYDADTEQPLIYEVLLYHLGLGLRGKRTLRLYSSVWNTRGLLARDLEAAPTQRLRQAMRRAVPQAVRAVRRFRTWGAMHRLEPRHVMAGIPLLGRFYRFGDWGASGGSDTVMKTAHGLTARRHHATLASTARHLSDMSDIDHNWFVLLGGQDGWIGSTTLVDQTVLWRQGKYIQVPLRTETIARTFPHRMELHP